VPGQGSMDFGRMRRELDAIGYDGALIIELYRRNFGSLDELTESEKFLNEFMGIE
jgi:sugar phosphate isomerase/epimerase